MLLAEQANPKTTPISPLDELATIFRVGYGPRYVGDDRFFGSYVALADIIISLSETEAGQSRIVAANIIRSQRITAGVTTPDRAPYPSRRVIMTHLLHATRLVEPQSWTTIASDATGMMCAAEQAGMQLLTSVDDVAGRLHTFGELDKHTITKTTGGLAVSLANSVHGDHYEQLAWGWPE